MKKRINRRRFLAVAAAGGAVAGSFLAAPAIAQGKITWRMALAWPKALPGAGANAQMLAKAITTLSDGRLNVQVYGANELIPPFEIFDSVREGRVEMGHCMAYYWLGKSRVASYFAAVPGGLTASEQNAWLYYGGGQALWDEFYGEFGLKALSAGTFATQMGGWFKTEIKSLADLKGKKVRMSGLTGEVYNRLGATTVQIPAAEIVPALQSGVVDAAEWVGGWNDLAFGFPQVAKYYYGPGPQEGGATLECMMNKAKWDALPNDLKAIVEYACKASTIDMLSAYTYHDVEAMDLLVNKHAVNINEFPEDVRKALFKTSNEVVAEVGNSTPLAKKIHQSYFGFRAMRMKYDPFLEKGFLNART